MIAVNPKYISYRVRGKICQDIVASDFVKIMLIDFQKFFTDRLSSKFPAKR